MTADSINYGLVGRLFVSVAYVQKQKKKRAWYYYDGWIPQKKLFCEPLALVAFCFLSLLLWLRECVCVLSFPAASILRAPRPWACFVCRHHLSPFFSSTTVLQNQP
jgi:hypothetical protein